MALALKTVAFLSLAAPPSQAAAPVRWIVDNGALARGADAAPAQNTTVPEAEAKCAALEGCAGFTFEASAAMPDGTVEIYFKSKATNWNTNPAWWSYSKPVKKASCGCCSRSRFPVAVSLRRLCPFAVSNTHGSCSLQLRWR